MSKIIKVSNGHNNLEERVLCGMEILKKPEKLRVLSIRVKEDLVSCDECD